MLDKMFNPKRIAVIGASRSPKKVGHDIFKSLLDAKKKVYAINPNAKKILGKKAYPSILDVKEKIDLAIIAVPSKIVPIVMKDVVKKKVPYTIIISSGFSEIGNEKLEKEIIEMAKNKTKILGPNCLGIINPHSKLNASFFDKIPQKGKIAFISQSGALGVAILDWAIKNKIGLSSFVSIGNAADIKFHDLINYFEKDKKTKVICLYIESVKEGKKFLKSLKSSKKPIIILKAGKTKAGEKAAFSHTAALATSDKVYDGIIKQGKAIRVDTLYQLFEVAQMFALGQNPKGKRVLIITNAGGPGVIASDAFENAGMEIVKLPEKIIKKLNKILPKHWSHGNPIDIVGDALPERYKKTLKIVEKENFFDLIFVIVTPQSMTNPSEVAKIITRVNKKTKYPIFCCFMGGYAVSEARRIVKKNGILNFLEPGYAADVISKMVIK